MLWIRFEPRIGFSLNRLAESRVKSTIKRTAWLPFTKVISYILCGRGSTVQNYRFGLNIKQFFNHDQ
jgi:hypothetical protein